MIEPAMSVLLVTPDNYQVIRKTVNHLRKQTIKERLELIIIAPSREGLNLNEMDVKDFGRCVIIEAGKIEVMSRAKVLGVRAASTNIIAFAEDHCYPEPEWAAALLAAHQQGWAAVGPEMKNANPQTNISWAGLILHYGCCLGSAASHTSQNLPWHNTSYKRDLLLKYEDKLAPLLSVEGMLFDDLQAQGHEIYWESAAKTAHLNISLWSSWTIHAFWGGRLYGARRAEMKKWPWWRRLIYIGGAPLIPLWRLPPTFHNIRRNHLTVGFFLRLLPSITSCLLPHALGEATGYALGVGNAERRYTHYEMKRIHHVTAQERELEALG